MGDSVVENEEPFGELYCLKTDDFTPEEQLEIEKMNTWNQKIVRKMSTLHCEFTTPSHILPNGINVVQKKHINLFNPGIFELGKGISKFILNTYLVKRIVKVDETNGEKILTYNSPVNVFLDKIDKQFVSILNNSSIESIKSILNHPHFTGCKSVQDIQNRIPTVKDLNKRFITIK